MPNPLHTPHARPKSWGCERVVLPEHNVQSDITYLMGFPSPYSMSAFSTRAVAPWPGGPPPAPLRQRACTSTFVELHAPAAPAHSQTTTHKHKQMEPSPLPPASSCADNPFSAAADSVYSLYEDSKAFLDASLDITGLLASPAPARAPGDRQSPQQAEQQPLACYGPPLQQLYQQLQASERAKDAAVPDDFYEYLLDISDFPSPRLRVREGVAGTRGRGDEAGGDGAGKFASTCMNQAAVIGNPTGSTMVEVNSVTGCAYGCIRHIRIFLVDPAVTDTYTYINHS